MKLLACGVEKKSEILVLSPYRAQCHIIEKELAAKKLSEVSVTSIVKSQGTFERKEIVVVKLKNLTLAWGQASKWSGAKKRGWRKAGKPVVLMLPIHNAILCYHDMIGQIWLLTSERWIYPRARECYWRQCKRKKDIHNLTG